MMQKMKNEGQHLVYTAMQYEDGPIALRYARGSRTWCSIWDEELKAIPIGSWETLKEGTQSSYFNIWYDNNEWKRLSVLKRLVFQ